MKTGLQQQWWVLLDLSRRLRRLSARGGFSSLSDENPSRDLTVVESTGFEPATPSMKSLTGFNRAGGLDPI